jgi:glucose-1-phosphate thymidylyltransferase
MITRAVVLVGAKESVLDPLLPLANRPFLFHVLDWLRDGGVTRVALVLHPSAPPDLPAEVENAGLELEIASISHDPRDGLAVPLSEARRFLGDGPFVLHLGDSLARSPLAASTGPLGDSDATLLVAEVPGGRGGTVVGFAESRLAGIVDEYTGGSGRALAGVALFGAGLVEAAGEVAVTGTSELELMMAVARLRANGGQVETREVEDWWRLRGRRDGVLDANRFVLEDLRARMNGATLQDSDIQGNVAIDESARLRSTIVRGPVVIGPGVRLTDAYVGPYTSIGADVSVEGAEIDNSIILPGATISHLGRRLEASVIGSRATVCRDFNLPRAIRLNVGAGAQVSFA